MDSDRCEWVEIIEPRTKEQMYANLATGECVWDPPLGVQVKKTDDNQWWELFDSNTSRFYYYNASNQKTVWHKPQNCDIIPLAKLQTLKHNTEPDGEAGAKKESIGTQTVTKICSKSLSNGDKSQMSSSTQTTPPTSPSEHRKHSRHYRRDRLTQQSLTPDSPIYPLEYTNNQSAGSSRLQVYPTKNEGILPGYSHSARSHDSGRSSDSSSVSQSHSSLDGANYMGHRKLESCSTDSISSTHSSSRHTLKEVRNQYDPVPYQEVIPTYNDYNSAQFSAHSADKTAFRDLGPIRQCSFEQQRAPPAVPSPRQFSMDSSIESRQSDSQFWIPSTGRNRSNTTTSAVSSHPHLIKASQIAHPKYPLEDYPLTHREMYANAPSLYLDNNMGYVPESMCTPMSSRRQWLRKSTHMDGLVSSQQIPVNSSRMLSNADGSILLSAEYPSARHGRTISDLSPHSLDLSLHDLDSRLLPHEKSGLHSQHKCVSELAILSPRLMRNASKRSARERVNLYSNRDDTDVNLYHNYNSGYRKDGGCNNQNEQPVPLYSNIDYPTHWDGRTDNHTYLLPLQHYLLEQAKLSGCKLSDMINDDGDSFSQSDDSDRQRDDDDDFADDEGMSHQDSSSQEYLDNYQFFGEEYDEDSFYSPVAPNAHRAKSSQDIPCNVKYPSPRGGPRESNGGSMYASSPIFSSRTLHPVPFSSSQFTPCCPPMDGPNTSSMMEKSQSFQTHIKDNLHIRPFSALDTHRTNGLDIVSSHLNGTQDDQLMKKGSSKGDIEKYAEDNLNRHKKGIFRKKFSVQDMLSWSKDPIRKPMIMTTDKSLKRDACEIFKLIQTYMLDHKTKSGQTYEGVVLDIATRGWSKPALRDELYIQICRQTTDNPKRESLVLGWELMAVCLSFFPPSIKFHSYLQGYIDRHKNSIFDTSDLKISHYATICGKRLERIAHKGAARSLRKPSIEEIEQSRIQIFRPSMFGSTLKEVMALQKARYPGRNLPWIQTTLSEAVLQLNGAQTEGIFRVPGDIDEVNTLKLKIDQWEVVECSDPHVPASLLKQWYRELFEPLIPDEYYEDCILYCNEPESAVQIVQKLPEINRLVFSYLIRFLQVFAAEENCAVTKMDSNNLAMVMAPNCLRCMAEDPRVIFENTRKEMAFMKTLIENLDTTYMEGVM